MFKHWILHVHLQFPVFKFVNIAISSGIGDSLKYHLLSVTMGPVRGGFGGRGGGGGGRGTYILLHWLILHFIW